MSRFAGETPLRLTIVSRTNHVNRIALDRDVPLALARQLQAFIDVNRQFDVQIVRAFWREARAVEPNVNVTRCPVCFSYCCAISVKANFKSDTAATKSGSATTGTLTTARKFSVALIPLSQRFYLRLVELAEAIVRAHTINLVDVLGKPADAFGCTIV